MGFFCKLTPPPTIAGPNKLHGAKLPYHMLNYLNKYFSFTRATRMTTVMKNTSVILMNSVGVK